MINNHSFALLLIAVVANLWSGSSAAADDTDGNVPIAPLPAGRYACQVDTVAGKQGLALIQAHDKQEAARVAAGTSAVTVAGGSSPATAVLQCIDVSRESFTDRDFQKFYREMPM
ncbi:hypothetical protein [Kineobactrum salinum]|uniref:Uncharacterized protein n=1 Tax=Kineobactrum salinum TaxID=2708301 RepID=A0A6C0TYC7_9GAMM|nr:hypothetical protein [Kineobactrum salinum]QIB64776.1 hypothetical protein G3T16_04615 [Kineobactrum salinum]